MRRYDETFRQTVVCVPFGMEAIGLHLISVDAPWQSGQTWSLHCSSQGAGEFQNARTLSPRRTCSRYHFGDILSASARTAQNPLMARTDIKLTMVLKARISRSIGAFASRRQRKYPCRPPVSITPTGDGCAYPTRVNRIGLGRYARRPIYSFVGM